MGDAREGSFDDADAIMGVDFVTMESDGTLRRHEGVQVATAGMEDGSVLLRTLYSEVCGTDVHLSHRRLTGVPYPIIPGHVSVGRVERVKGAVRDVGGKEVLKGAIVTFLDVIGTCNACITCLVHKQSTRCPSRRVIGITCPASPPDATATTPPSSSSLPLSCPISSLLGGWSSLLYLPPLTRIIHLPPSLPPKTFIAGGCGLPTALHAVDRSSLKLLDCVVVQGSGPVGLLCALLSKLAGAGRVIVVGGPADRLAVVRQFGIDDTIDITEVKTAKARLLLMQQLTGGAMADVVFEATGQPSAVPEGMNFCRDGGTYIIVGQYTDNGDCNVNPHYQINRKHLTIHGCWGSDFSHFHRGVQLMAKCAHLPWDLVTTKEYGLRDVHVALDDVERQTVFKAVINPQT